MKKTIAPLIAAATLSLFSVFAVGSQANIDWAMTTDNIEWAQMTDNIEWAMTTDNIEWAMSTMNIEWA